MQAPLRESAGPVRSQMRPVHAWVVAAAATALAFVGGLVGLSVGHQAIGMMADVDQGIGMLAAGVPAYVGTIAALRRRGHPIIPISRDLDRALPGERSLD